MHTLAGPELRIGPLVRRPYLLRRLVHLQLHARDPLHRKITLNRYFLSVGLDIRLVCRTRTIISFWMPGVAQTFPECHMLLSAGSSSLPSPSGSSSQISMCSWVPSSTLQGAIHSRKVVAGSYPRRPKGDCDTKNHDILSHLFRLHVNHGTLQPLSRPRSCQHVGKLLRRWMQLMRPHCHEAATRLKAAARSTGLSRNGFRDRQSNGRQRKSGS
jgi:hypothetical protein